MASFTWNELIARAKTYVDDDHDDEKSWISDERWLQIANVEYQQLYKRWIRAGLITPAITTGYITDPDGSSFTDVLAIVGVAKDFGDFVKILNAAQPVSGHNPFWRGSTEPEGCSTKWAATGTGDTLLVTLDPIPDDLEVISGTSNYFVRYVPTVARATDSTASIELPFGADERLVLGMARRAHLKDSGNSALLNGLITEADAELNFTAMGKVGGAKVKRLKQSSHSTPRRPVWPRCQGWLYL